MWADLGLGESLLAPVDVAASPAARRHGSASPRCCSPASTCYLLDEPTNDLDLDGLARLERFVTGLGAGVVIVSHDRTFLERTVTDVVELDEFTHAATHYAGGWTAYLAERAAAQARAWEAYEEYDAKRSTLAARAQREREWASQGLSRAKKKPDDNDKFVRNWKINQTEQLAGRAARTERGDAAARRRRAAARAVAAALERGQRASAAATWSPGSTDAVVDRGGVHARARSTSRSATASGW